jgi:hypothetical protein
MEPMQCLDDLHEADVDVRWRTYPVLADGLPAKRGEPGTAAFDGVITREDGMKMPMSSITGRAFLRYVNGDENEGEPPRRHGFAQEYRSEEHLPLFHGGQPYRMGQKENTSYQCLIYCLRHELFTHDVCRGAEAFSPTSPYSAHPISSSISPIRQDIYSRLRGTAILLSAFLSLIMNTLFRSAASTSRILCRSKFQAPTLPSVYLRQASTMQHIVPKLNDPTLLKTDVAYVNGEWVKAKSRKTFEVQGLADPDCSVLLYCCV